MSNQKIFSPAVRKRKAYFTAFQVFMSYFWLKTKSKVFGQKYYNRRINDLHLKNADRIKTRVQELQGLFIKFGQLISNLSNVLPEEFRAPLEELQDHIQPKPYTEIEATIEKELGKKPDDIFTSFNKEPLAAASIGQVHRATLNGEQVIIKIQHKNIDTIAHADLEILQNLVKLHGYFMDMQGLDHTYEQVRLMIEEELDYQIEAKSMVSIDENLKASPELGVKIPKVYQKFNTKKILVAEFCEGTKIGNTKTIEDWGLDKDDLAKRLIELYCKMILVDGFYHADPHPGNILVNKENEIVLLDFGATANLSEKTKKAIPELIEAVISNDTEGTVLALKQLGFIGADREARKYVEKLVEIFKIFLQDEVEFDGMNFQNIKLNSGLSSITSLVRKIDLRDVSNNIKIPKEYILLNRTVVLLVGNAFQLAPELNTLNVVRPYIKQHIIDKDGGFTQMVINTFKNQVTTAISLPNELSRFLKNANDNTVEEEMKGVKTMLQKLYFLGQQFLFSLILIALIYGVSHFSFLEYPRLKEVSYLGIGVFGGLLVRAFIRDWRS